MSVIDCAFDSEAALYMAYMPFVKGGGLFIRTTDTTHQLDDMLELSVVLMDEQEPFKVNGRVVWVTPLGAQGNRQTGIGIQFIGESSRVLCNKIETYLAGMLKSNQLTDTL